jgi:polyhydroxyalkanoate synthase subunit PhaC
VTNRDQGKYDEVKRWEGYFSQWTNLKPVVGQTLKQAIWKKNKATLWYYPSPHKRFNTPLYLIYSLVNQPYILDLGPNMSMIEAFGKEGYDVYLIDFGIPGYEDKNMTLDDHFSLYIHPGAKKTIAHAKAEAITVIGFCLGGTLAAIYAASAEEPIQNLVLLTAPVDFSQMPVLDKWAEAIKNGTLNAEPIIDTMGLIPASAMRAGMRLVTSPVYFSPQASLLQKSYDDAYVERWRRFNMWADDHIPMPGATLKQLLHDFGKENKLMNNTLKINNKHVSLKNIKANTLTVSFTQDRLVPDYQIKAIMKYIASKDKTYLSINGGHASSALSGKIPDYLSNWLKERS